MKKIYLLATLLLFSLCAIFGAGNSSKQMQTISRLTAGAEEGPKYTDGDLGQLNYLLAAENLTVHRALGHGQYVYVLAFKADNTPYLFRVDKKGVVVQQFATGGCTSNTGLKLADIALSSDGWLFGCSSETLASNLYDYGPKIYKWSDTGDMSVLYENKNTVNACYATSNWGLGDAGQSMTFIGTSSDGQIVLTSENVSSTSAHQYKIRTTVIQLAGGVFSARHIDLPATDYKTSEIGSAYRLHTYNQYYVLSGSTSTHAAIAPFSGASSEGAATTQATRTDFGGVLGFNICTYKSKTSLLVPGDNGITIYDVNDSFTGTSNRFIDFGNTVSGGFQSAGVLSGDTLWLLRNGHLEIFAEECLVYERAGLSNGKFGTICLEYASESVAGAEFYSPLMFDQAHNQIVLEEVEGNLEAGKPYIFKATGEKLTVSYIPVEMAEMPVPNNGLIGTFTATFVPERAFFLSNNKLYQAADNTNKLADHRAYFPDLTEIQDLSGFVGTNVPKRISISVPKNITTDEKQMLVTPVNGKFIRNGRLMIVNDGIVRDVMGNVVE